MLIFLPLIYLFTGFLLGKFNIDVKGKFSYLLTKLVIPLVIIHNIATYQPGVFIIILSSMIIMVTMILISRLVTKDPLQNLCFSYLNIGWLGLPIVSTLFGNTAAMVFISIYVGNSILGNAIGPLLLSPNKHIKQKVLNTFRSPPVIAFTLGVLLIPCRDIIDTYTMRPYEVLKFFMSFLGMSVLGIWLSQTKIIIENIINAWKAFILRGIATFFVITVFILICSYFNIQLVTENKPALYLICILPPAANIIILETHYIKTGRSASMIACGTLISIIAIGIYTCAFYLFQ